MEDLLRVSIGRRASLTSFFSNDAVNRANVHVAIAALAQYAGGVFVFVFLLKAGVSPPLVLCTLAGISATRFLIRPFVLPLARKIGVRNILILGTMMEAITYLMLPHVTGPGRMLFWFVALTSIGSVFYWTCYHAYYAALGDEEKRGEQVGGREAIIALVGIVAPVLGGLAIASAGPQIAFYGIAIVQICAALPLLGAADVRVEKGLYANRRDMLFGATLYAAEGLFAASFFHVWQIALFITLGEKFQNFGGAMALAGIASAAMSFGIGKMIDLGHGRRSITIAFGAAAVAVCIQATTYATPGGALIANGLGALAVALTAPTIMIRVYSMAKASGCPLRFAIATEGGWDIGCATGCLTAAAMLWAGMDFTAPILLSLVGVVLAGGLLVSSHRAVRT